MNVNKPAINDIFFGALDIEDPRDVAAYLDEACRGDAALRLQAERLLKRRQDAGNFLGGPSGANSMFDHGSNSEQPGTVIGPYKLVEQLGEGGFGVVFLAEQERPVRRRVALKVVKPGMDTREVIARFEAERQALALMDHPNIAKVYDAGATETGRPYFVMEMVQGIPITEYCDQCQLTTNERLELFVTVCQAVQHAHQKGIIHRDLKPNNVLVAMQDGKAAPKIIDFGVAKAIGEQTLTERTLTTAFAQMVGTPMYMSPEQAELSPLGVDTRSDIYSLGVMLYELLTGATPFDKDRLHAASYDELRRIIREEEPPRPSARLSSLSLRERAGVRETANVATTIAERRRTDPRRLIQTVRGELDWIVMKCLEKDRNRRYETPNSLARDVVRYLNDEPVQACPPSAIYRLRKYVRRNKVALAFVTLLLGGLVYLAYSNTAIKRERDAKAAALADANAISYLLQEMLASSYPNQVKDAQYTVRELLDDFSAKMSTHLAGQPEVEAAIRSVIGRSYWRLGVLDSAELNLKKAIDLRRQAFGANDERVADSLVEYAWIVAEQDRIAEGETCAREALSIYQQHNSEARVINASADAFYFIVLAQLSRGDAAGYRATCEALVDLPVRSADVVINARPIWPLCLAPDALDDMSRLVKRAEEFVADDSLNQGHYGHQVHYAPYLLGAALYRAGRYAQAAERLEESISAYPALPPHGFDSINYQRLLLAMTKWQLGHQDEARQMLADMEPAINKELQAPSTLWHRRTSLELLRSEAEAMIGSDQPDAALNGENPQAIPDD